MQKLDTQTPYITTSIGSPLYLLKEKAAYCQATNSLFIADTHFGKAGHFRKAGIAVPESVHLEDYKIIEELIHTYQPANFYFLGDLFHSDLNAQWVRLEEFLEGFTEVNFILIKGNHDILPKKIYQSSTIKVIDQPLELDHLILSHEPMEDLKEGKINLCGHIHPGFSAGGSGARKIKVPCFHQRPGQLILPAFGKFTGLYNVTAEIADRLFLVTGTKVILFNLNP
ncbi:ligase-associated DNA damage response endonuclease PdeM [Litoribacter alkaliphilus]|uniref:Ligase-associated DNA damage response endonuclease PdeM n=1 Tax=Litoribacter ruber TaxID=702568 RepID=A0AAP2CIA2_9BACT|nr:ligase-associated DNA damage response endonuclease PdeM [Litoribacter alkaliphilus]MBS9525211.1 ligase-associated DNA damage response endonuclease PdeM [Litoribacter alkaliphilus]